MAKKAKKYLMEDIISFETAKLAKSKGFIFDGRTNSWLETTLPYHEDGTRGFNFRDKGETFGAPTQALLQKWLREKYGIMVVSNYRKFSVKRCEGFFYTVGTKKYWTLNEYFGETLFKGFLTYEEALEAGLQVGLKMIKKNNKRNEVKHEDT